mgnify:CR=1 FL=1
MYKISPPSKCRNGYRSILYMIYMYSQEVDGFVNFKLFKPCKWSMNVQSITSFITIYIVIMSGYVLSQQGSDGSQGTSYCDHDIPTLFETNSICVHGPSSVWARLHSINHYPSQCRHLRKSCWRHIHTQLVPWCLITYMVFFPKRSHFPIS